MKNARHMISRWSYLVVAYTVHIISNINPPASETSAIQLIFWRLILGHSILPFMQIAVAEGAQDRACDAS